MKIRPLHDRVVVRRSEEEATSAGGMSEVFTVITETRETKGPRDTPIFIG